MGMSGGHKLGATGSLPFIGGGVKTLIFVMACSALMLAQSAPPQSAADQPYTMEYYYKVQWGHQQEFLQLFLKNHYPLLKKIVESGRMLSRSEEHTSELQSRGLISYA